MYKLSKLAATLIASAIISLPALAAGIVTVNGSSVSQATYDAFYQEQLAQGIKDSPELKNAVREELIRRELLLQEARKSGIDKNSTVAAQMDIAKQAVLVRAFVQNYVKKHPVSDAQLKSDYDTLKSKLGTTEYKTRHILVDSEDKAKTIIDSLKKGSKFDDLAKQSLDQGSKDRGGELGWSGPDAYVGPFAEALTKLTKGKFTDTPVKTNFGYHVIQLDDTRPLEVPPFDKIKPQLAQRANQMQVEKMLLDLRNNAKIQ